MEVRPGLHRVRNDVLGTNTYFVRVSERNEGLIIDPGLDVAAVEAGLVETGLKPLAILCTHGHFDHIGSAHPLQAQFDIPFYLHPADEKLARESNFLMKICKIDRRLHVPTFGGWFEAGVTRPFGSAQVQFHPTPGHTPGSCFISVDDLLFTGDTLYRDGVGLVEFPGEKKGLLKETLLGIWDRFPDSVFVCPGHGGAADFGTIKRENRALRDFLGVDGNVGHEMR